MRIGAMRFKHKYSWLVLGLLLVPFLLAGVVEASSAAPRWFALSGGGGATASNSQAMMTHFAMGQPLGTSSSQNFGLGAGLLHGLPASPPLGAKLESSVIASAGGDSSSASFRLGTTLGQGQPVGASSSQNFGMGAGFVRVVPVSPLLGAKLESSVIASAGGDSSSASFRLGSTFGQGQPVGTSSSQNFGLGAGFRRGAVPQLLGDLNGDRKVDSADLRIVMAAFGTSPPSDPRADVDGDKVVGLLDLIGVALRFGDQ